MSQDERIDQQHDLPSSMEAARENEPPSEQEEGRPTDLEVSNQGVLEMREGEDEGSTAEEQVLPQPGEIDTPPQGATESVEVTGDPSDDDLSSRMPTDPPAKETVVVAFEQQGTAEE